MRIAQKHHPARSPEIEDVGKNVDIHKRVGYSDQVWAEGRPCVDQTQLGCSVVRAAPQVEGKLGLKLAHCRRQEATEVQIR